MAAVIPFNAGKHPRAAGGKFGATGAAQAAAAGRPTGAWAAGPVKRGTGHGAGKSDPRVKAEQLALNRAGITDERGRPLLVDGDQGAHTTAAVKKFQTAHGMAPTGIVDAKTMLAILTAKPAPRSAPRPAKKTARSMMSHGSTRTRKKTSHPKPKASAPVHVERVRYQ